MYIVCCIQYASEADAGRRRPDDSRGRARRVQKSVNDKVNASVRDKFFRLDKFLRLRDKFFRRRTFFSVVLRNTNQNVKQTLHLGDIRITLW